MPPALALVLCTVFVLFLLRLERKQAPEVSHALWIPTIWMLSIASKPLAIWFGVEGDPTEGSPLDRVFLSVLLCLGLLILVRRKFSWSSAIRENPWVMLLIGYMLFSILWSDIPFVSFKRWIREFIAVTMAFLLATEENPRKAMESLLRRSIYILIPFSLLLIKYFPEYGREYHRWTGALIWIGVTTQKNGLGRLCLISAFFLVWTLVRKWWGSETRVVKFLTHADVFVLFLTLWLLKGPGNAYSASAIVAFASGLTAFVALLWIKKLGMNLTRVPIALMLAFGIFFGTLTLFAGGSTLESFATNVGREKTLTGRTEVWAELIPVAMQKPILGWGFGRFWTPALREKYRISEAHSGYLDILLVLGFVGLLLFSVFLLSCCRKAQRELIHNFDWGSLWICYLLASVVHNITESSLNSLTTQLTAVLLFLAVCSSRAVSNTPGPREQSDILQNDMLQNMR